jgi:BASS family bile acid:Na+ symporter
MFRFWRSFPFMVAAGLITGLATGGFPETTSKDLQQIALILAMAFSLTEISFRGITLRAELRAIGFALAMSYGLLGGLVILFGVLSPDPGIRSGWILMASVPPAVAVVPVTSFLKGDVRRALISDAVLYCFGLVTVPGLCLLLLSQTAPVGDLVVQTVLLIGLPIIVSRPLRRWPSIRQVRSTAVSLSFFVLVLAIAGSTRDALLGRPDLIAGLLILAFVRTFGLGLLVFLLTRLLSVSRDGRIAATTFAGFKNLGLTVVLAFSFFGVLASLPAIASLILETLWMITLPFLFRVPPGGVDEIPE